MRKFRYPSVINSNYHVKVCFILALYVFYLLFCGQDLLTQSKDYQTYGAKEYLPVFYEKLAERQVYPLSWLLPSKVWKSQNAGERLITKLYDSAHEYNLTMQKGTFDWLDDILKNKR